MDELHDAEPITFDEAAAERLATRLKASASDLRSQLPHRNRLADAARAQWRGAYEVKFGARMGVCARDFERIAAALDKAAGQVEELARLAGEEQARRTKAREWKARHDEWQREQDSRNLIEKGLDLLGGDDEPKPPDLTPTDPPRLPVAAPAPGSRE
jgi:hypothetical protein